MDKTSIKRRIKFNFTLNKNIVTSLDNEVWKIIPGHELYSVSNKGRIKNNITGKLMTNFIVGDYYKVRKLKIIGYNVQDITDIKTFNSVLEAANFVNTSSTNVSRVCKANADIDKLKYKCKGYYFVYEHAINSNI